MKPIQILLCGLLFCCLPSVVSAAPPMLDILPALAPALVQGQWQGVVVTVTNPATGTPVDGEVQVELSDPRSGQALGVYTRPVHLPAGAGAARIPVTIAVPETTLPNVTVYLVGGRDGNGAMITRRAFSKLPVRGVQPVLVAVSGIPDALQYIGGETLGVGGATMGRYGASANGRQRYSRAGRYGLRASSPAFAVQTLATPQDLPDNAAAYDVASLVYLGSDTVPDAFTDRQVNALRQWVSSGGCLVVGRTASAEAKIRSDERFRSWIPPFAAGASAVDVHTLGMGTVCTLGFEAADLPRDTGLSLWRRIARLSVPPVSYSGVAEMFAGAGSGAARATLYATRGGVPGLEYIGGFLVLYIVLLIPINYLLLKRLQRREWAWGTIPLLVVLFSVGAYGFGYATKGGQLLLNTASLVEMGAGSGDAVVSGAVGIFTPVRARYRMSLAVSDGIFGSPLSSDPVYSDGAALHGLIVSEGDRVTELRNADVPMWSFATVSVRTHSLALGQGIEAKLKVSGTPSLWQRIDGTVTNRTGYTLHDVVIRRGDLGQKIGDLSPGQSVNISIDRRRHPYVPPFGVDQNRPFFPRGTQQTLTADEIMKMAKVDLTESVSRVVTSSPMSADFASETAILTGWIEEPLLPVTVDGKSVRQGYHVNLVVVHCR